MKENKPRSSLGSATAIIKDVSSPTKVSAKDGPSTPKKTRSCSLSIKKRASQKKQNESDDEEEEWEEEDDDQ